MPNRRRSRLAVEEACARTITLSLILIVAGCASGPPLVASLPAGDIVVPEHRRGRLAVRNGCTYLRASGRRYTVVWPGGFRWDPLRRGVVGPDGAVFRNNDLIVGRGGDGSISYFRQQQQEELYRRLVQCGSPYTVFNEVKGTYP